MQNYRTYERFPRAAEYNPEWVLAGVSGGANALCLAEWLSEAVTLKPGMRVLDLGCGRALSSIFFHREFGVQVWAADLWFSPWENLQRIQDAGVGGSVFPINVDARSLPFAAEFFDVITSVDSFCYYGTDESYLGYLSKFLKPGGQLAIAGSGLVQEFGEHVPSHLENWWNEDRPAGLHSASWWKKHWERTGIISVTTADAMPDGWKLWADWLNLIAPENTIEIDAIKSDAGRWLGYTRTVGNRLGGSSGDSPEITIPPSYQFKPMLRSQPSGL